MKLGLLPVIVTCFWGLILGAEEITTTVRESSNGYLTLSGSVNSENSDGPFLVTLENGGLPYTTLTDGNGRWSLVIQARSQHYSVSAKPLIPATTTFESGNHNFCAVYSNQAECESHSLCRWAILNCVRR